MSNSFSHNWSWTRCHEQLLFIKPRIIFQPLLLTRLVRWNLTQFFCVHFFYGLVHILCNQRWEEGFFWKCLCLITRGSRGGVGEWKKKIFSLQSISQLKTVIFVLSIIYLFTVWVTYSFKSLKRQEKHTVLQNYDGIAISKLG